MPNQLGFFDETHEDLPLWSGTCIRVQEQAFKPKQHAKQESFIDLRPQFKGKNSNDLKIKPINPGIPEIPICCSDPKLVKIGPNTWQCDNCQAFLKPTGGDK